MRRRLLRLLVVAFAVAAPVGATALTVSLAPGAGSSSLRVDVFRDFTVPCCVFTQALTSLPVSGQLSIPPVLPLIPPFEATIDYDLGNAAFDFGYLTVREDAEDNFAGAEGTIFFTVDQAIGYVLSGSYVMSDPAGDLAAFTVVLEDLTAAATLYESHQDNFATPDAAMVLGDPTYEVAGSGTLTGTLLPGHDYRLHFDADSTVFTGAVIILPPTGAVGTGTGGVTLAFVPEARPMALLALALVAFLLRGRGRPGPSRRPALCYGPGPWSHARRS